MTTPTFGVRFTTDLSAYRLEDWLRRNCNEEWDLQIESLADDLTRKTLVIMFSSEQERTAFKLAFRDHARPAGTAAASSAPAAPSPGKGTPAQKS